MSATPTPSAMCTSPGTGGSSSIKKVLPAILNSSGYLRARHGRPVYGTVEMPSLNFDPGWTWYQEKHGRVLDPYELLAPVLQDAAVNAALGSVSDDESGPPEFIANGGAAMVMVYEDLTAELAASG